MHPFVSVIIPVYNVEKYVEQCVNSVRKQKFSNLEIILIDDGSNDNSGIICDRLKSEDNRIRVFHQKNQGLSVARNIGIENATGEWLYFIDSDDWISEDFLTRLLKVADETKAEIVCCNSIDVHEDGTVINMPIATEQVKVLKFEETVKSLLRKTGNVRFEVWNKLWKKSLVGNIRFIEGQVSEDVYFDRILFMKTNKIAYLDAYLHYYRIQRPGNTNTTFKVKRLCIFQEFSAWIRDLKEFDYLSSISIISYIACNSAAGLYYVAQQTGQEKNVLKQLIENFDYFYKNVEKSSINTLKLRLFKISPYGYCLVSKLYKATLLKI